MRLEENRCPNCDSLIDGVRELSSGEQDGTPSPGDVSICAYCGEVLEFDKNLKSIKVTDQALSQLSSDDRAAVKQASEFFKSKFLSDE